MRVMRVCGTFFFFWGGESVAQEDGAIRIVTKITTKDAEESLDSLEYQIKKSAKYMDTLRQKMDALKGQKIPTREYKDLQAELARAEKELQKLVAQQEDWEKIGITSGGAWDTLSEEIEKADYKIDDIKAKMQSLTDAGKDFTLGEETFEYKGYERQLKYEEEAIVKAGEHYKKLASDEDKLSEIKKNSTVVDQKMIDLLEQRNRLAEKLKELEKAGVAEGYEEHNQAYIEWKNAADAVKAYRAELDKQTDSGQAKIAQQEAKAAEKREEAQRRAEEQAEKALQRENERIQRQAENEAKLAAKEAERQTKIQAEAAEEQRLDQIRVNATVSNQEIVDLLERRRQLISEIKDMEAAGVGLGYQQYEDANRELEEVNGKIKEYRKNLGSVPEKFNKMRKSANKAFTAVAQGTKKSSGLLSNFTSRLKGIALSLMIFNWISKGFNAMISGMKKGFENFAGYSDSYAQNIQNMKNAMSTLGNQFAAAFAPIVQMVIPWLTQLVSAISTAMTYVAQFIAVLSGKSTFTKAKKVQDDYNKSLGGTAKAADKARGALAKFDDLDVLEKKDDASGGGAELDNVGADMFEEVPIDKEFSRLAEMVEDLLDRIKKIIHDFSIGDFFQAGKDTSALVASIFDFFSDAIDKVNWYKIGRNIGEFFCGIEWGRVLKSVGRLIWKALKAALEVWKGAFDAAPVETGIATAIGLLKFTKLGSILKSVLLPKINDALGKVSEGLDLKGLALGIAGVIGEFVLISDAFEGLTSGAQGVSSALGEIVIGAGLAVGALKLIGLSNPFTAVIVGITGVAGAIKGMADAKQEAMEKFLEDQELSVFGGHLSDITDKINAAAQATKERMEASMEYVKTAGLAETQLVKDLADRYFELADKENKTNQETEEMQRLSDVLIQKFPDLKQYYDDQTGLLNGTRDAINNVIEAKLKEIQLNAIEEQLTKAYEERTNALIELDKATIPVQNAIGKMTELQKDYETAVSKRDALDAYERIGGLIEIGKESLDDLQESQALYNLLTSAGVDTTGNLEDIYKELQGVLKEDNGEIPTWKTLNKQIEDSITSLNFFQGKYQEAFAEFSESKSAYETVEKTISNLSQMMSEEMQGVGNDFSDGYAEGILSKAAEVEEAADKIGETGIYSLKDTQKSNSPSKVTMELGNDFVDGYNKGIEENIPVTQKVVSNYIAKIVKDFRGILPLLMDVGKNAMSSLLDGIASMENAIYKKLNDIIRNISDTVKAASNSLSGLASGSSFSPRISRYAVEEVSAISNDIPRLATGSVIRGGNPFMAILGDQPAGKTNIEAPLDTIKQAVREELSGIDFGSARSGQTKVVLNINGVDVGEAVLDDLFSVMSRRGYDVSVLGVT